MDVFISKAAFLKCLLIIADNNQDLVITLR